ncbi:MAG: phosphoribosylaminoimidazolesuccinocarboxamide synthase [Candidatus Nitrosocaldus sp.]
MIRRVEGSSKDLLIEVEPKGDEMGIGYFIPKDTFSIFDYKVRGRWPFSIPHKGLAMRYIISKSFELASNSGIKTCFIEAVEQGCKVHVVRVPGRELPLDQMEVEVGARNRMVDLEFIFNYYLHPRSSLLADMRQGKKDYRAYGFTSMPEGGELIPASARGELILSYTTKYDKRGDISLSKDEARIRSRLTDEQWSKAHELIKECTMLICRYAEAKGLLRFDGKYEVYVDSNGDVGLADTFGNPEEDRYMVEIRDVSMVERFLDFYMRRWRLDASKITAVRDGLSRKSRHMVDVSKQFLRNWYIDNGWRQLYSSGRADVPPMMPRDAISAYTDCMLSFASLWSNKTAEIVNATGILVRPIAEVASELYALEHLNRSNLLPMESL